jgi:putative transposase
MALRRVTAALLVACVARSHNTLPAAMARRGIAGISQRRFRPATTQANPKAIYPPELIARRFDSKGSLHALFASDITYLALPGQTAYLSRGARVLGWSVAEHMDATLVRGCPRHEPSRFPVCQAEVRHLQ